MRIPTSKSNKKILVIITAVTTILLATAAITYHLKAGPFAARMSDTSNLDPATDDQKTTGNDIKQSTLEQVDGGKESTGSDPSPAPQTITGSDKKLVGMEISAANQTDTTLEVRSFIQTVTNSGMCSLLVKNPQGATYIATAEVQALSSMTTCKGFNVPLNQLSAGTWTIVIDFANDNLTANASKEITIK